MLLGFDSVHTALAMFVHVTATQNVTVAVRIVSHEPVYSVALLTVRVHMYTTSRPAHKYSTSRPLKLFSIGVLTKTSFAVAKLSGST